MPNRLAAIQDKLVEADFDILALVPGPNYYYATGAPLHASERLNLLFVPKGGNPVALAPALEAPYLQPLGLDVYTWRDEEGPAAALQRLLDDLGATEATLGVEYGVMRFGEAEALCRAAPEVRFRPADEFIASLRMYKDEAEVQAIRYAEEVTERALQRTFAEIRPGQTELEVAARLRIHLFEEGAEEVAFGPLVVSGPRTAEPHAGASDRVIQPGDIILIDCGAKVNHYSGDITRCAVVEPVAEEVERIYALCLAANEAGRAAVHPERTGHEVDMAARRVIEEGGYGDYFIHRTGHGLGLEGHEPPYVVAGNEETLLPGNVVTIEPGIYVPGLGGVRVEDIVVVTETGAEVLSAYPRELIRIPSGV